MWIAVISLPIAYYYLKPKKPKPLVLQKPYFKKDVAYMVQFPVSPQMRTISPFALKLETYLRMNKVDYEPIYCLKMSRKGQIPYIELNGEQIADSNIIIKELENRGNFYSKMHTLISCRIRTKNLSLDDFDLFHNLCFIMVYDVSMITNIYFFDHFFVHIQILWSIFSKK